MLVELFVMVYDRQKECCNMEDFRFAGAMLRLLRLGRDWSQETLCHGICTVSYLSKIEQGKVAANEELLKALFLKLDIPWDDRTEGEGKILCQELYDLVFADDTPEIQKRMDSGALRQESISMGTQYLDYLILRAYCCRDKSIIQSSLMPLLSSRQLCLIQLLEGKWSEAAETFSCALTVKAAGIQAYRQGDYIRAIELLQRGYDMASDKGYVRIMLLCRVFMANCYSDLHKIDSMRIHYAASRHLARALGETEILRSICYNEASTAVECGDYEAGYAYFSSLEDLSVMDVHKLAICCEKLHRPVEAITMLNTVKDKAEGIEKKMCDLVMYRLKHKDYIHDTEYGNMLMDTFREIRATMPAGYAKFHLSWVEEWCTANRQYRTAYELMKEFS